MSIARLIQIGASGGGLPFYSFVDYSAEGNTAAGTTFTVDYPGSVAVGDIVVAVCFWDQRLTLTSASLPSGYTFIGSEATLGDPDEYPDPVAGFRIYDGTEGTTVTFPSTEAGSEPYSAILLVFRPDASVSSLESKYAAENGPNALSVAIEAASASTPAIGIAISCGRPTSQTPTLTATGTDATTTVSGTGLTIGNMMFAYKLYGEGDSTSDISTSTDDSGRQCLVTCVIGEQVRISARYWGIAYTVANSFAGSEEVEFFSAASPTTDATNPAQASTRAFATSEFSGSFSADLAFDDNTSTRWASVSRTAGSIERLWWDFQSPIQIVGASYDDYYGLSNAEVQYSDDGVNWTTIASLPVNQGRDVKVSVTF